MTSPRIIYWGWPGDIGNGIGGAQTELAATLRLWRQHDLDVTIVPTWTSSPTEQAKLAAMGIPTITTNELDWIKDVPNLHGSISVSFCNQRFLNIYGPLRNTGSRIVWANCMTSSHQRELPAFSNYGLPDAIMFQSEFQRRCLELEYRRYGYDRDKHCHLIRGAFDPSEHPYHYLSRKRPEADPFTVGRIARGGAPLETDKWPRDIWRIYDAIDHPARRAVVMGASAEHILPHIGRPPAWATVYEPGSVPVQQIYNQLHAFVTWNGLWLDQTALSGARENWPRVGLEAMSSGVPLVVPDAFGWQEMLTHNLTGLLGDTPEQLAALATELARDEPRRERLARNARDRLHDLADPDRIWQQWSNLFEQLSDTRPSTA